MEKVKDVIGKKEYVKEWRQVNKEHVKAYAKKYSMEHKEKISKRKREWYQANRWMILKQSKIWRDNNREHYNEYQNKYYLEHKGEEAERNKKYYQEHKEERAEYSRKYHQEHKEESRIYQSNKLKTDLKCNLNNKISGSIYKSLKKNKGGKHWETLVGYGLDDLKRHLKKTMPKGYTWEDCMEGRLHIDHKIPISAFNFDKTEHTDFQRCWALSNLQLLPAKENQVKSNHLTKPFQPALKI